MKQMSILTALLSSVIILSASLLIGGGNFNSNNCYLYGVISAVLVLLGGLLVSNIPMKGSMYGRFKSYLPILLYSSVMSLSIGNNFLYISVAGLYVVFTLFYVVSNNRNPEPMAGFIFKNVILVFILTILHPAMIWLIIPLIGIVAFFRSSVGKELSVILFSFILFSAVYLWCSWFFEFDMSGIIENLLPEFSFCDSVIANSVALGMLLFVLLFWTFFKRDINTMDILICKLVQYSFLCIIVLSLLLLVFGYEWLVALLAAPVSIVVFVHHESLESDTSKCLFISAFFLILVILGGFMLCNGKFIQLLDGMRGLF